MARIAIMALEGLEEVNKEEVKDDNSDIIQMLELDDSVSSQENDVVEEASDIRDSVVEYKENVKKSLDSGEGVSEREADAIRIATEHFCKRLEYKKKLVPSLENFKQENKIQGTKDLLCSLEQLQLSLEANLLIAQENLLENMAKSIQMLFETSDKVANRLSEAVKNHSDKGQKEGTITGGTWARYIKMNGKVTADEFISHIKSVISKIDNLDIEKNIYELEKLAKNLTKEVRGNWFLSNRRDIERIEDISDRVSAVGESITSDISIADNAYISGLDVLSKKDVEKVSSLVIDLLTKGGSINKSNKKLNMAIIWLTIFITINHRIRLKSNAVGFVGAVIGQGFGSLLGFGNLLNAPASEYMMHTHGAEDLVKAYKINTQIGTFLKQTKKLISYKLKLASAAVSYIQDSTK